MGSAVAQVAASSPAPPPPDVEASSALSGIALDFWPITLLFFFGSLSVLLFIFPAVTDGWFQQKNPLHTTFTASISRKSQQLAVEHKAAIEQDISL